MSDPYGTGPDDRDREQQPGGWPASDPGQQPQGGYGPPHPQGQPHPYGQQPGYGPPAGYGPPPVGPPKHPNAVTSMVVGIISVAGGFMCVLPLLAAPFAWVLGGRAVKAIDASGGTMGGRGEATAGRVLGIIGTVLLVLGILALIAIIALAISAPSFFDSEYSSTY